MVGGPIAEGVATELDRVVVVATDVTCCAAGGCSGSLTSTGVPDREVTEGGLEVDCVCCGVEGLELGADVFVESLPITGLGAKRFGSESPFFVITVTLMPADGCSEVVVGVGVGAAFGCGFAPASRLIMVMFVSPMIPPVGPIVFWFVVCC